ncbi:ACT domain-containing protein [Streptomyces actinomycinicus]|uniref:ACT domain-containing protein n=1 Tax=Streptomyces actinomycinicus TaxID=1695166 RepID=A0A937JLD1_9ACTN|nr:ACT domain-containing protein [Streptomyces actinomycinicus]MBL1082300.1 ACT domain-containing protein [Streptomyces actinomycinicus]
MITTNRRLSVLPSPFVIEHLADRSAPVDDSWFAAVRAPEGLTVIREAPPAVVDGQERWIGLYGDDPHELDLPGMLAAVVGPLGAAGVPVFVTSTFHSDLVLVPQQRFTDAAAVLRTAGHTLVETR